MCHRSGRVRLPEEAICEEATLTFKRYCTEMRIRCSDLARERTSDETRQRAVVSALMRKIMQWRQT